MYLDELPHRWRAAVYLVLGALFLGWGLAAVFGLVVIEE
jgi:hypothetical protein